MRNHCESIFHARTFCRSFYSFYRTRIQLQIVHDNENQDNYSNNCSEGEPISKGKDTVRRRIEKGLKSSQFIYQTMTIPQKYLNGAWQSVRNRSGWRGSRRLWLGSICITSPPWAGEEAGGTDGPGPAVLIWSLVASGVLSKGGAGSESRGDVQYAESMTCPCNRSLMNKRELPILMAFLSVPAWIRDQRCGVRFSQLLFLRETHQVW